jgi:hypothetical protein
MAPGMREHLQDFSSHAENVQSDECDASTLYESSSVAQTKDKKWSWFKNAGASASKSVKIKLKEVNKFGNTLRPTKKHEETSIGSRNASMKSVNSKGSAKSTGPQHDVSKKSVASHASNVSSAKNVSSPKDASPAILHSTSISAVRTTSSKILDQGGFDNDAFDIPGEISKGSGNLVLDSVERIEREQTESSVNV